MEFTQAEKTDFAIKLKARVNEVYAAMTQNSKVELYHSDVCKITAMLEQEFVATAGEFPSIINGACRLARAFLNPDQVESKADLKKGMGLLITTAGGLSIIWGIASTANIATIICAMVLGVHIPFLAPVAIVAGMAAVAAGVYSAFAKQTPQARLAKAHDILIEAISNWADERAAMEKDLVAKEELRRKASSPDDKTKPMSTITRIVTWPFRTVADYVDDR